jgi:hypothetical protein
VFGFFFRDRGTVTIAALTPGPTGAPEGPIEVGFLHVVRMPSDTFEPAVVRHGHIIETIDGWCR